MCALAVRDPIIKTSGGVQASIDMLKQFPEDEEVVQFANRLLWNMTKSGML